jgi:glyoxylase-like metal-dependent hydrolase (beta-lactamase superfamily II)
MIPRMAGQTRRELLRTAVAGAAGLAFGLRMRPLGAQQSIAADPVERLADDLYVLRLPGQENIVAHTTGGGVVLVDGGAAAAVDAVTRAVAALPGSGPVTTLFNTHWHPEQTGLNETVGKAGRVIIAHENTRLWLTTDVTWPWNGRTFKRLPKIAQPNKTFYTTGTLETGVKYGYIPDAAHTDGDLYVFFPTQNVLAVGGVMSAAGWPVVDWPTGGWIGGIVGGLQRLVPLVDARTRIIPSRGPVLGAADLKTQLEMYGTIYDRLTQLLNKGRGPTEAVDAKPTREFDAQMGNGDEFVRRAFESLWAYLSPDA